jgi:hypothetical protein
MLAHRRCSLMMSAMAAMVVRTTSFRSQATTCHFEKVGAIKTVHRSLPSRPFSCLSRARAGATAPAATAARIRRASSPTLSPPHLRPPLEPFLHVVLRSSPDSDVPSGCRTLGTQLQGALSFQGSICKERVYLWIWKTFQDLCVVCFLNSKWCLVDSCKMHRKS